MRSQKIDDTAMGFEGDSIGTGHFFPLYPLSSKEHDLCPFCALACCLTSVPTVMSVVCPELPVFPTFSVPFLSPAPPFNSCPLALHASVPRISANSRHHLCLSCAQTRPRPLFCSIPMLMSLCAQNFAQPCAQLCPHHFPIFCPQPAQGYTHQLDIPSEASVVRIPLKRTAFSADRRL